MFEFCRRFLGPRNRLRRVCETEDFVQEAFVQAMENVDRLENDAAFYAWVRTIIRRRISLHRRDDLRERDGLDPAQHADSSADSDRIALAEEAIRILDAILELFPEHPEAMAVFSFLQFEDGCSPDDLVETLGLSRRTVYRRLEQAIGLLRARLGD